MYICIIVKIYDLYYNQDHYISETLHIKNKNCNFIKLELIIYILIIIMNMYIY